MAKSPVADAELFTGALPSKYDREAQRTIARIPKHSVDSYGSQKY